MISRKALLRLSTALSTALFLSLSTHFAARADTPASQVITTLQHPAPEVPPGGEGWFDLDGFCKVVDVSSLSNLSSTDRGAPVWTDGAAQWATYRQKAGQEFDGDVMLTTCCPPLTPIPGANLCTEAGATVKTTSRNYGKNGEIDTISATCTDEWGAEYNDSINVQCVGSNTANGIAQWMVAGADTASGCTPNAYDTGCYAACSSESSGIRYDSCGHASPYNCYGGACPPPPAPTTAPTPSGVSVCTPVHYCCGGAGVCYTDCSGGSACSLVPGNPACDPQLGDCGGSTWHTQPTPCTACSCFETNVTANGSSKRVKSGPGCCEQNNNCY